MVNIDLFENTFVVSFYNITRITSNNIEDIVSRISSHMEIQKKKIILNFSGIRFIDSKSFDEFVRLIELYELLDLKLINASDDVKELIKLKDLQKVLIS